MIFPCLLQLHRLAVQLELQARGGFVDQIDRLVGPEARRDVTVGKPRRGHDGAVGDLHPVVHFVALLQTTQNGDGVLHRWLGHGHHLEAALERGILLDVLAVFVHRGGADAVQLSARQRRLDHVGGIERAFGRTGAHQRVQLVDEENDLAFALRDRLEQRLEALLEFTAELRARHDRAHVEYQELPVAQCVGHIAVGDALRETLHDGGLAHARIADEHGVVLGAAGEDLHRPPDLLVAADHRVGLPARARAVRSTVKRSSTCIFPSGP